MKNTGKKKSSKNIGLIVGRILTVILVLGVLFAVFSIYRQDQIRAAAAEEGLDASPIKVDRKKDYGEAGLKEVAKNEKFTLYTDFTTGEICVQENATGYRWYSNPLDKEEDKIIAKKPTLSAQFYLTCMDMDLKITKEEDNFSGSIKKGNMNHELVENGVKYTFAFPTTGVVVPVQYTLNEDGLLAQVLVDEIDEQWSNRYLVTGITMLPWFGAGNLTDEGYLFVPDGSGAVMGFNNDKNRFSFYTSPVYGQNATTTIDSSTTVKEVAQMPIFGINKKAEDQTHGLLAVITEGETSSTIIATTSRKTSSYNCAYISAVIRDYKAVETGRFAGPYGTACTNVDIVKESVIGDRLSVQYFLLEEGAAEYSDMANCYREYLQENGGLKQSDLADKNYMILDLYGAVSIEKYVMGVKRPVITALTTYNDVVNIVKELKSQGVENLIINYLGAMDTGLNNNIFTKVKTESKLGTAKEFNAMVEYLKQEGVILFLETNPIELHQNGNGYNVSGDSVKGFFQHNIFQNNLKLDSGDKDTYRWRLLQPYQVPEAVRKFVNSVAEKASGNVSISKIGEMLYSNYDSDEALFSDRRQTLAYWEEALKAASEESDYVLVHKGNIYCAPYADVIVDMPSTGSQYDMEDYSVPFYQMLLRGGSVMGTEAINASVNYSDALLKALEIGSSLKYSLIASDVKDLIGTEYNHMMSYSYDFWKDTMVAQYKEMQEASKQTEGQAIVNHCYLQDGVTLTEYANGTSILVNYTGANFYYNGKTIAGGTYLVQGGTE